MTLSIGTKSQTKPPSVRCCFLYEGNGGNRVVETSKESKGGDTWTEDKKYPCSLSFSLNCKTDCDIPTKI